MRVERRGRFDGQQHLRVGEQRPHPAAEPPTDDTDTAASADADDTTDPAAVDPAAVEPAAVDPAAVEPAAVEPAADAPFVTGATVAAGERDGAVVVHLGGELDAGTVPGVRAAVAQSRSGRIGVIGTAGTIGSGAYQRAFAAAGVPDVAAAAAPRFVPFVEAGVTTGDEVLEAAHEVLAPLLATGIDTLVLGCTHYPLLTAVISYVMGDSVNLVSSAEETARDVYRALIEHDLQRDGGLPAHHEFLATGDPESFETLARRFLEPEVLRVRHTSSVAEQYPPGSLAMIHPA